MSLSLALATIGAADFDHIYEHLLTHAPSYANMHLRQHRTEKGRRRFRYLHAMRIKPGASKVIEGMISGPEILWSYEISRTTHGTAMKVRKDKASPAERARLAKQFKNEILLRIQSERASRGKKIRSNWLKGQFYLRRNSRGMPSTHPHCLAAIEQGVLHEQFLSEVLPWGFELLHP